MNWDPISFNNYGDMQSDKKNTLFELYNNTRSVQITEICTRITDLYPGYSEIRHSWHYKSNYKPDYFENSYESLSHYYDLYNVGTIVSFIIDLWSYRSHHETLELSFDNINVILIVFNLNK